MTACLSKRPEPSRTTALRRALAALSLVAAIGAAAPQHALAGPNDASLLSAMSMLPVAVSVAAPVMVLTEGAKLSVKAVESTAQGSLLVLERASDGAIRGRLRVCRVLRVVFRSVVVTDSVRGAARSACRWTRPAM